MITGIILLQHTAVEFYSHLEYYYDTDTYDIH
jgi:hypothetical protein